MAEVTEELLDEMVTIIVETVAPEQVILFGSRATGKAGPNSDVDLMVIQSEPENRLDVEIRLSRALSDFLVPIDILIFGRDEVERWRDTTNHVVARALRHGKVLYERP